MGGGLGHQAMLLPQIRMTMARGPLGSQQHPPPPQQRGAHSSSAKMVKEDSQQGKTLSCLMMS